MSEATSEFAERGATGWYAVPDGPDDDLRRAYLDGRCGGYLAEARAHRDRAEAMLAIDGPEAEREARAALYKIVRAFWWAEDGPEEDPVHETMHELGRWVRETFGCTIMPSDRGYEQKCPVAIAHKRIGLSIGYVARRMCSLCGEDLSECPHMPGTAYLVPGGVGPSGRCAVCLEDACTEHDPNTTYRVSVTSIVTEGTIEEVSLVDRPVQPEARLAAIPLSTEDLQELLGPEFLPGMPVSCDQCLLDCQGFTRLSPPSTS